MVEFLIEFVFEFIVEVVGQCIVELGIDLGFGKIKKALVETPVEKKEINPVASIIGLLILGLLFGLASIWVYPEPIFSKTKMSGIGIVISSIATGLLLQLYGDRRRKKGKETSYFGTFWGGSSFAFAWTLVRLLVIGK